MQVSCGASSCFRFECFQCYCLHRSFRTGFVFGRFWVSGGTSWLQIRGGRLSFLSRILIWFMCPLNFWRLMQLVLFGLKGRDCCNRKMRKSSSPRLSRQLFVSTYLNAAFALVESLLALSWAPSKLYIDSCDRGTKLQVLSKGCTKAGQSKGSAVLCVSKNAQLPQRVPDDRNLPCIYLRKSLGVDHVECT